MEYKINEIPFKITEITAKLFNSPYLSDVTFIVDGQYIYAHSLVLMVRSSVFQAQLESTWGEKKLIPISDYGYEIFYQLIRFMYTDQMDISDLDGYRLIKLANQYNVIRLVNELLNNKLPEMKRLNFCVTENHQIGLNCAKPYIAFQLQRYLAADEFLKLHPDTVAEILKFNQIETGTPETYIIDALVRWMNHQCLQYQISFSECSQKYAHLIRLVRFPTLSNVELQNILHAYPDLLTTVDFLSIASHTIYGAAYKDTIWNCTPRAGILSPYQWNSYPYKSEFETKFTVSSHRILGGFVIGGTPFYGLKRINIKICCQPRDLVDVRTTTEIHINDVILAASYGIINLGASIQVRPDSIYTIRYTFGQRERETHYLCHGSQTKLIINANPLDSVQILEAHATMLEISFLDPDGGII